MPLVDIFSKQYDSLDSPLGRAIAATPNDIVDLDNATRAIYIGTAGNLKVTMLKGGDVTFSNLPVGWHPIRVSRVWATGTDAADIVLCW